MIYKYRDIIHIKQDNETRILRVVWDLGSRVYGFIYDENSQYKYSEVYVDKDSIIGLVPDGQYFGVAFPNEGNQYSIYTMPCRVKDGQVYMLKYNNKWQLYNQSSYYTICAIIDRNINNLNLSNKRVALEENIFEKGAL